MRRLLVATLCLAGACGKAGGSADLRHLPASAALVVGMTRSGSEAELLDSLKPVMAIIDATGGVPHCALETFAKIETLAVAVSPAEPHVVVLVRGRGLRAAFESCIREVPTIGKELTITDENQVTRYHQAGDKGDAFVAWLDGDTVLAGPVDDAAATAALRTLPPLTGNAAMMELLGKVDTSGALWAAADVRAFGEDAKRAMPPGISVERVWASIGAKGLVLDATIETGSSDAAAKLVTLAEGALTQAPRDLAAVLKEAVIKADGARVTIHADVGAVLAQAIPGSPIPATAPSVAVVGILAAVAIPAFMKNARRAKTTEATILVKKLFDGARAAYVESASFPPSAGPTPPLGTCCQQPKKKCAVDPTLWTDPTWKALGFSMDDPHYYSYRFTKTADGFKVAAYGDLNCDGVYSTFEMTGKVGSDGIITGAGELFKDKELE